MRVKLERGEWVLGDRVGGGGFGRVVEARSETDDNAVAKLVPKEPGAERELLFADLSDVRNVVPIIDSGETDSDWVLIMPRAEESLRQYLDEAGGPLGVAAGVAILSDLAEALADLDGTVVHRDIKPENILRLDGRWCLADFGISRYAESTTAPDTRKYAMTPLYTAPERWRNDRATSATDVYAIGVVAYEILSGSPPFNGPATHDFREQHLTDTPPHLASVPAGLASLIEECLYKSPQARPGAANLVKRLQRAAEQDHSTGLAALQEANRAEAIRLGESSRLESAAQSEGERRSGLLQAATSSWTRIADTLKDTLTNAAPTAAIRPKRDGGWTMTLKDAELEFTEPSQTTQSPWGTWKLPAFDVIAHAAIGLRIPPGRNEYEGRVHSLWYCDAQHEGRYQWFETAFMVSPLIPKRGRRDPFAIDPSEDAAKALWNGMAE